jgi:HEAT repeat protein
MIRRLFNTKSRKTAPKPASPSRSSSSAATAFTTQIEQLHAGDWTARATAARELGKLGNRRATSALCAALRDPAAEVAQAAAIALGEIRDKPAVPSLAAVVLNADEYYDGTVRAAAAEALAKFQDHRAVEALIAAVYDSIAEVSQAAVRALGLIGDERAIDCLVSVVRNTNNYYLPFVRQAAVEALGRLAAPSAQESLRNLATDSHLDPAVRQAAGAALATAHGAN